MGRKIDMKKIEDVTKCQVTFSKRRSSLMKKANEIAVCCDVDVAFVAFSPSGRVSKFCNQKRIEEVLHRYVNLPADKRLNHMSDVEEKTEKLKQLGHINGDTSKLQYLDKQIENLELQIKKRGLELQILETELRDYELGPEQEPSLHQLSWCERNLNHSLQRVIARKDFIQNQIELDSQPRAPFSSTFNEKGQVSTVVNPVPGQILMQLDPWISPYSAKVRESIFQDLFDQAKHTPSENLLPSANMHNFPLPSNISNFPIQESPILESEIMLTSYAQMPAPLIPLEQPLIVDQPLFNFHDQNNVSAWKNTSSGVFSDAAHMSIQSLSCNIQDPRFMSITTTVIPNPSRAEMPPSLYDEMGIGLQCANANLMSQFCNMEGQEIGDQLNMDHNGSFIYGGARNNNIEREDYCRINNEETQKNDQSQDAYYVHPHKEVCQDAQHDSLLPEDTHGDKTLWTSKIRKSSLWEWEDLLLDENFNLQFMP